MLTKPLLVAAALSLGLQVATPSDSGSVEGTVSRFNGDPIQGVRIGLARAGVTLFDSQHTDIQGITDSKGHFLIENLLPGEYSVTVHGYGVALPGQSEGARATPPIVGSITVRPNERLRNFSLQMVAVGTISGRVLDASGTPVPNLPVRALRVTYRDAGRPVLASLSQEIVKTNDRGDYRLYGLPSGEYYIVVDLQFSGSAELEGKYVATYYPGTRNPASAQAVRIAEGRETSKVDFAVQTGEALSISGRLVSSSRILTSGLAFTLWPTDSNVAPSLVIGTPTRPTYEVGELFTVPVDGLAPGSYEVLATAADSSGRTVVNIDGMPLKDVLITLDPGVELRGRITVRGEQGTLKLESIGINFQSNTHTLFNTNRRAAQLIELQLLQYLNQVVGRTPVEPLDLLRDGRIAIESDGKFTVSNLQPDSYAVNVYRPRGMQLVDVIQDGKSVLDAGIQIASSSPAPVELVVRVNGSSVSQTPGSVGGLLEDAQHRGVSFSRVILIPKRRQSIGLYRIVSSDQAGKFLFEGVPPGEYKLFAWKDVPDGAWTNGDYMQQYEEMGTAVNIVEGSILVNLTLRLIP